MPDDTVTSLSEFVERVRRFRQLWNTSADRELWFRGERKNHKWKLRPKIYRPPEKRRIKPVSELTGIIATFVTSNVQEDHEIRGKQPRDAGPAAR